MIAGGLLDSGVELVAGGVHTWEKFGGCYSIVSPFRSQRSKARSVDPVEMEESQVNLFVHRENQLWAQKKRQLPVTLVTGFLGAGQYIYNTPC